MKAFIVYCHPSEDSFTKKAYEKGKTLFSPSEKVCFAFSVTLNR